MAENVGDKIDQVGKLNSDHGISDYAPPARARALPITNGSIIPATSPAVKSRRMRCIHSSRRGRFGVGLLVFSKL